MKYWLVKSEGDCYSIDHLKKDKRTEWDGIRNYQARNYMKEMKVGDLVLFYHSITEPTGVYGIAKVVSVAHPDSSQFDKKDIHFDPKAKKDKPIWYCVDLGFVEKFKNPITLQAIKHDLKLKGIVLAQKGSRLSVQPVSDPHFKYIEKLGRQ